MSEREWVREVLRTLEIRQTITVAGAGTNSIN